MFAKKKSQNTTFEFISVQKKARLKRSGETTLCSVGPFVPCKDVAHQTAIQTRIEMVNPGVPKM